MRARRKRYRKPSSSFPFLTQLETLSTESSEMESERIYEFQYLREYKVGQMAPRRRGRQK